MRHQSSKVQALYEHCKTILSPSGSPPPSSQALQKLSSILGMSLLLFSTFNFAAFSPFKQKKQKKTKKKCILLFFRLVNVQLVQLGFWGCFKLLVLGTLLGRGEFGLLRLNWSVMLRWCFMLMHLRLIWFWRMRICSNKTGGWELNY